MPDEQILEQQEVEVDPVAIPATEEPAELPEETTERTKREFEKLKKHNRQLAEENEKLKTSSPPQQSALESLHPQASVADTPNLSPKQVDDIVKDLVDENGYLDQALLENTLRKANQQVAEAKAVAEQARQEASQARSQVSKFEETREVRIAHKKFPSVDPNSKKYDPSFFKLVKNELLGAMYEGRPLTFVDACREVNRVYKPKVVGQDVKADAVEEYKKSVAQKSVLNETGSSKPQLRASKEDLVEGTRRGDAESIYARLNNINS